jgi:putative Holliday junction resolvase
VRLLGLDIGERRIGVSLSDPSGTIATPLVVLDAKGLERDLRPFACLVEDHEVGLLVIGLPVTMAGDEGPQAAEVREVASRLSSHVGLPVEFVDERLTTVQARRAMAGQGDAAKRKGAVDMVAATVMLQAYLDGRRLQDDTESEHA